MFLINSTVMDGGMDGGMDVGLDGRVDGHGRWVDAEWTLGGR